MEKIDFENLLKDKKKKTYYIKYILAIIVSVFLINIQENKQEIIDKNILIFNKEEIITKEEKVIKKKENFIQVSSSENKEIIKKLKKNNYKYKIIKNKKILVGPYKDSEKKKALIKIKKEIKKDSFLLII